MLCMRSMSHRQQVPGPKQKSKELPGSIATRQVEGISSLPFFPPPFKLKVENSPAGRPRLPPGSQRSLKGHSLWNLPMAKGPDHLWYSSQPRHCCSSEWSFSFCPFGPHALHLPYPRAPPARQQGYASLYTPTVHSSPENTGKHAHLHYS